MKQLKLNLSEYNENTHMVTVNYASDASDDVYPPMYIDISNFAASSAEELIFQIAVRAKEDMQRQIAKNNYVSNNKDTVESFKEYIGKPVNLEVDSLNVLQKSVSFSNTEIWNYGEWNGNGGISPNNYTLVIT
jgi:hypothetical protein